MKFLEGGYFALAFRYDEDILDAQFRIEILNFETGELLKSFLIKHSGKKGCIVPLTEKRIIVDTSISSFELWNLKTLENASYDIEPKFELSNKSMIKLNKNYLIIRGWGNMKDFIFDNIYIWYISGNEAKFIKQFELFEKPIHNNKVILREFNENEFIIYSKNDHCISIWDIDGNKSKSFKIDQDLKNFKVLKDFCIGEAKWNLNIYSCENFTLIKTFQNTALIGTTPYEIFTRKINTDDNRFEVYNLDDKISQIGLICNNTSNLSIYKIEFDQDLPALIFSCTDGDNERNYIKKLNRNCK